MTTIRTPTSDSISLDAEQREERRALYIYPHVVDPVDNHLIGYVGNLSSHGLMLISYDTVQLGWKSPIRIILPNRQALETRTMVATIEARWIRPYAEDLQCIGCCFNQIGEEELGLIQRIQTIFGFEPDFSPDRWAMPPLPK